MSCKVLRITGSLQPTTTSAATSSSLKDLNKKIRQPYTITKSREGWIEQEHDKFLEALQWCVTLNYLILEFCFVDENIQRELENCVCVLFLHFEERLGKMFNRVKSIDQLSEVGLLFFRTCFSFLSFLSIFSHFLHNQMRN